MVVAVGRWSLAHAGLTVVHVSNSLAIAKNEFYEKKI